MCACFVVCDFVSCHFVEHRFSLVVYDKLYTTQNNVWKTSIYEGSLFVCTYGIEVLEYWMIFSLKIKLNCSWKFWRNWSVPLMSLERSWWEGFNEMYLVRFGFRMWEILIFKRFLLLKIQINHKKPGFGRKISWECGNTWRLTIQFKHNFLSYLAIQTINTYIAKQCSHVEFPYFAINGFTLGPMAHATLVCLLL